MAWFRNFLDQDFAKGRGLKPKVETSKLGDVLSEVVQLKRITYGGLEAEPPAAGGYGVIWGSHQPLRDF